jgi:hypothetical protein
VALLEPLAARRVAISPNLPNGQTALVAVVVNHQFFRLSQSYWQTLPISEAVPVASAGWGLMAIAIVAIRKPLPPHANRVMP